MTRPPDLPAAPATTRPGGSMASHLAANRGPRGERAVFFFFGGGGPRFFDPPGGRADPGSGRKRTLIRYGRRHTGWRRVVTVVDGHAGRSPSAAGAHTALRRRAAGTDRVIPRRDGGARTGYGPSPASGAAGEVSMLDVVLLQQPSPSTVHADPLPSRTRAPFVRAEGSRCSVKRRAAGHRSR